MKVILHDNGCVELKLSQTEWVDLSVHHELDLAHPKEMHTQWVFADDAKPILFDFRSKNK